MADILKMFDVYRRHLQLLKGLNLIDRNDEYICPICLRGFNRDEINKLSFEDAPQRALGGKIMAITCRICNNTCGHTIDYHIYNMLERMEQKLFVPGSNRKITIQDLNGGTSINAFLEVGGKDDLKMTISEKNNNPHILKEKLKHLEVGTDIIIQNNPLKVNEPYVTAAIIKNAYILLYSKFGFSFLLDKHYDSIRKQILFPYSCSIPEGLWTIQRKLQLFDGIYLSGNNYYRGFFIAYTVKRRLSYRFLVFIPTPLVYYEAAASIFQKIGVGDRLTLTDIPNYNYWHNPRDTQLIRNWVYSWNLNINK